MSFWFFLQRRAAKANKPTQKPSLTRAFTVITHTAVTRITYYVINMQHSIYAVWAARLNNSSHGANQVYL